MLFLLCWVPVVGDWPSKCGTLQTVEQPQDPLATMKAAALQEGKEGEGKKRETRRIKGKKEGTAKN